MITYPVKLLGRQEVAEGTTAFRFEKPAGFKFQAGQAVTLVLREPPAGDARNARRTFSLVSAPFESELMVATRMRPSGFKQAWQALPDGASMTLLGPFGDMTLEGDRARPAVFIAGGIGITPFMSMLRQAQHEGMLGRLCLVYSNRRPEDAAFLAELQALERHHRNFRLLATMTQMERSAQTWNGERGKVSADLIRRLVGDVSAPIYYLAGPPAMVNAMREMLRAAGVADAGIRSEEFYGY